MPRTLRAPRVGKAPKERRDPIYPEAPFFDCRTFKSTMSTEELLYINKMANECIERGDEDAGFEWLGKVPLPPPMALYALKDRYRGKEYLLEEGVNLADAEAFYGKDWMEKYGNKD